MLNPKITKESNNSHLKVLVVEKIAYVISKKSLYLLLPVPFS